jgi:hypothetical protein
MSLILPDSFFLLYRIAEIGFKKSSQADNRSTAAICLLAMVKGISVGASPCYLLTYNDPSTVQFNS